MSIRYVRDSDFSRALKKLDCILNDDDVDYAEEKYEYELDYASTSVSGYRTVDAINILILQHIEDEDLRFELVHKYISETYSYAFQDRDVEGIIKKWYGINGIVYDCEELDYDKELYESTAKCVVESLRTDSLEISDLHGKRVNRKNQSLLMTFPVELLTDVFDEDELPDDIITRNGKWTTPELDYWECSFALLAVKNDLITLDDVKPYTAPRDEYEIMFGTGITPWLSHLSDDDVLDLAVEMREIGGMGPPPYRALKSIGRNFGREFTDNGTLTRDDRRRAERMFNNMCS